MCYNCSGKLRLCNISQGSTKTLAFVEDALASLGDFVSVRSEGFIGLWRIDTITDITVEESEISHQTAYNGVPFVRVQKRAT